MAIVNHVPPTSKKTLTAISLVESSWRLPAQRALFRQLELQDMKQIHDLARSLEAHISPLNPASTRPSANLELFVETIIISPNQSTVGLLIEPFLAHLTMLLPLLRRLQSIIFIPNDPCIFTFTHMFPYTCHKLIPASLRSVCIVVRFSILSVRNWDLKLFIPTDTPGGPYCYG
jgi:hypothetical protein